ncbi:unnamed protein product [Kuraishia capsulata CBS 1993]|uniref:DNA-directed RNA polymerase I subunit RPA49 n=1 Tax=Kuraishia capsulata CBS 1993 TaxID=1382522 RepID=W6MP66_9ASCO|nr:uncharacterized protein KUCA_T00004034001 [Kuraishia capsulata CBS 1993]CDK28053.1 unnamed protein product [Kuraishia capsulata CBS 1993]
MPDNKKTEKPAVELKVGAYNPEPSVVVGSFFNGLTIPSDTSFQLYRNKQDASKLVLHGENEALDYDGSTKEDINNDYVVGVYDPTSKSIEFYKSSMLVSTVSSKASKAKKIPDIKQANVRYATKRNALGEEFGTKKARKAILDQERNRIDSTSLQSDSSFIYEKIATSTAHIPTPEEVKSNLLKDSPIPRFDEEATNVVDVYPLTSVIPKKEWPAIRVDEIIKQDDPKVQIQLLAHQRSRYLQKKLEKFDSSTSKRKEKFQILYYLSVLMGTYNNMRANSKENLRLKLQNPPEVILDSVIARFTVNRRGEFGKPKDKAFTIDPDHEDKLLLHILVLVLHLDDFYVDMGPMAQELSLKPSKLQQLFKYLGCTSKNATKLELDAMGYPASTKAVKVATLKVPFKAPTFVSTRGGPR